ncbi:tRNA glutamyl-Q(34) synthetase GluQRS [Denitratisoma oestradiolicum]|uniref:Glutamyl-Q tRNA(Asp) synthetase n=1 Tax=Denitratisoma oestradiolicum TaxID=311182 RepID=A0A6S6Y693_9PROT|nr:tRNA glutamyl-Q(34) synthetase GluQRS [Denitratisoma oestradiolicum]TWO79115.1 tRNA glutamyl-Q(34) synthetase GluQRS [Denitratisoma oestradiolicum]CAB1371030.1 Glutamyl-Q tRNA(Asp) synthetase [Denitratisoma oestradiolicum]
MLLSFPQIPSYCGRFAPSPTGPLHFGSLAAALGSCLEARARGGLWRVRMEDVDLPRCRPGADRQILSTLEAFGFAWDGEVIYQTARHEAYRAVLERLKAGGRVFPCACTRRELADSALAPDGAHLYPGTCRNGLPPGRKARAWRLAVPEVEVDFLDAIQGPQHQNLAREAGDFVLLRADGLFAYQLAVVVDDAEQGITHVLRGADLLDSTPRQIHLQHLLGYPTPAYAHLPVAVNELGEKLSKQTQAAPVDPTQPVPALVAALNFLGQKPPTELARADLREVWQWALAHWDLTRVPRQRSLPAPDSAIQVERGMASGSS